MFTFSYEYLIFLISTPTKKEKKLSEEKKEREGKERKPLEEMEEEGEGLNSVDSKHILRKVKPHVYCHKFQTVYTHFSKYEHKTN